MLGHKRMCERYDPLGVVALITPWNYSFAIPLVQLVSEEYRGGAMDPWWYPYGPHVISLLANTAWALYAPLRRRPWAPLSLLLNRRARRRVNLLGYVRHLRAWW
ncbi:MAG: aldehyde dehydrogenase family protein [Ardenticatenia bacterium]|nr:aldehyde dehydrogenase family protein [Ardenticatenia bacterium]